MDIFMELQTKEYFISDQIIPFEQGGGRSGLKDVVAHFKKLNGEEGWGEWEVDQVEKKTFFLHFFFRTIFVATLINMSHRFLLPTEC